MSATGVVREWHGDEGWGIIDSAATPGGCWAHFSSVLAPGHRSLEPGATVSFTFEAGPQDGFDYRATAVRAGGFDDRGTAVRAGGSDDRATAVRAGGEGPDPAPQRPSAAYRSTLRLDFDEP